MAFYDNHMNGRNATAVFFGILAIGAMFAWMIVLPVAQEGWALYQERENEKREVDIIEATASDIRASVNFFRELDEEERRLAVLAAPEYANAHDVAILFERLALENGLLVTGPGIRVTENVGGEDSRYAPLVPVRVSVSLTGSYESYKAFLDRLERSLRILKIQESGITTATNASGEIQFDFSISGVVYYAPSEGSGGTGNLPTINEPEF